MGQLALLATLFAPFLGAIVLLFVPNREPLLVRAVAAALRRDGAARLPVRLHGL